LHEKDADKTHTNPLGRAMSRITKYAGNTLLQSGKFATKNGLMYIVKRTSSISLEEGGFAREEEVYEIKCADWRGMRPPSHISSLRYDSWWMRLQDLYSGGTDRAYWIARDTMNKYGIAAMLVEW
jgi:hypothetical protein